MSRFLFLTACAAAAVLPLACTAQTPATGATSSTTTPASGSTAEAPATTTTPAAATSASQKTTYNQCHVDGNYVAMTFDDGPHAQNTPRLLDMLKERKIHATFFMVGECAVQY